eukprot:scaffold60420_cov51-Phaeocystis_antarctica.AAC.1
MQYMFSVRSSPCPAPNLQSRPPLQELRAPRSPSASRLPVRTRPGIVCPPCDSAVHVQVQPAAELRHVQGHNHVPHVQRALRACSAPQP